MRNPLDFRQNVKHADTNKLLGNFFFFLIKTNTNTSAARLVTCD